MLDDIYNGLTSREIVLDLGLTNAQVHNIKRRINRKLLAWVKKNMKEKIALVKPDIENKPGESTPDTYNNGELI